MSGVDDRMVSMKFDNATFSKKLSDTITDLSKLRDSLSLTGATTGLKNVETSAGSMKTALELKGATKGIQDVETAAKNANLSTMAGAVQNISDKFDAMHVVAAAAITRVTHMAVDAGIKLLKSFTLDPINAGFQEFETNMNSIQTILANTESKGSTLDDVNRALDQLNQYSDQTIYNFGEMARNIGTFTAAGVDLDTSVNAIKGIANVAAISGSNSQQASTAMYQLSQAIASGSVKLMDWNSVVNAGMGGEVFQTALFNTAKKMGTIANVPLDQSFADWKAAGNSFRETLRDGWLTGEVLTETLSGFTGDLTEAQILSMGYTKEQAAEIMRLGTLGKNAATQVKTLTQLIGTIKESVGSGWSATFRTVIGDFEESKQLFTSINTAIGGFVGRSADARNQMLKTWKDFGGRTVLIESFKEVLSNLGHIIKSITDAFREFFPKTTAFDLITMTGAFSEFVKTIHLNDRALENINSVFRAFFSTLKIGWEVVKGLVGVVFDLFGALFQGGGDAFNDIAKGATSLADFNEKVLASGAIPKFFERIGNAVRNVVQKIKDLVGAFLGIFSGFGNSKALEGSLDRVNSRVDHLKDTANTLGDVWRKMGEKLEGVRRVLDQVWGYIATWFKELGSKIAAEMQPGDFDAAVDVVNVGLLGGIALLLKKFLNGGLKINFGDGLFEKIGGSFDQLTGTLKTMQADLKAKALLKIAGAVGILAASMVALSMIDSAGLTRAMIAMTVGFGELIGVMTLIDKIDMGTGAFKMNGMASAMVIMATAMGVLSMAVTNLSQLSLGDLAKGLGGVAVSMGIMVTAMNLMTTDTSGMVRAGIAMGGMAVAMRILAEAVQAFATMSWAEMARGMSGVAIGLGLITAAAHLMPKGMAAQGAGLVLIAGGMRLLAEAVEKFGGMDMAEMGKGLLGVGGGLVVVAGAMHLMPQGMVLQAAALIGIAGALNVLAMAVGKMAELSFGEMAKGIGGLGAMLAILAGAMHLMNGTLAGAAATVVVSGALVILSKVLRDLSELDIGDLAMGLGAMAGVFALMGGAAYLLGPLAPSLLAVGFAMGVVGGAFALFGVGAMAIGKAFELVARSGAAGAKAIVKIIEVFVTARVKIVQALVGAIIEFAQEILQAAPLLIKNIKILLGHVLDTIIELVPKIAKTIATIITEALKLLRDKVPDIIATGFELLMAFLTGIRDNISEIVTVAAEIVTGFMDALSEKIPELVDSAYNLIFTLLTEVAEKLGYAAPTLFFSVAEAIINGFIKGFNETWPKLKTWLTELPGKMLGIVKDLLGIKSPSSKFLDIGVDIITGLLNGLTTTIGKVTTWLTELPGKIVGWVGDVTSTLLEKGKNFISGLISGFVAKVGEVTTWFASLAGKIVGWVGDVTTTLKTKGIEFIRGLLSGAGEKALDLMTWVGNLPGRILSAIGDLSSVLYNVGRDIMEGLWEGLKSVWGKVTSWLSSLDPRKHFNDINPYKGHAIKNLVSTGGAVMQGLWNGMKDGWDDVAGWLKKIDPAESIGESNFDNLNKTFNGIVAQLRDLDEFNPVITPVLDLTKVHASAKTIDSLMKVSSFVPEVSLGRAHHIAPTAEIERARSAEPVSSSSEVKFEQNIYSPTALSTADIYRNTKSQIAIAKEELAI